VNYCFIPKVDVGFTKNNTSGRAFSITLFFQKRIHTMNKSDLLKKAGIAGFLFFLIKGLVWVGIGIWAWLKIG
jgi:hypothetical protein